MSETGAPAQSADSRLAVDREKVRKSWRAWSLYLLFLVLFTWVYIFLGAGVILRPGNERAVELQRPYVEAVYRAASIGAERLEKGRAISARVTNFLPYYSDGSVEPLWPWLVRGFADEPPNVLLEKGRWTNLFLCCGLLVLLGVGAARAFSFTGAAAMLMMGGFGIILERSAFFTPDALYNLLVLLAWLASLSLIRQNHLWMYGVFGVLLGLVYLARPPVWPLLTAFLVVSVFRTFGEWFRRRRESEESSLWVNSNQLVGFAILATAFILVTGPRLSYASANFGYLFHSYADLSVWLESPEEARRVVSEISERGISDPMPWRERPGVIRYLDEHSVGELWDRAYEGARSQLSSSVIGRQGGIILYGFLVFFVVAALHRWAVWRQKEQIWKVRGTSARWMLLFLAVGILLTLFHVGVGHRVIPNNSMTTALFLPMLMTFIWIAERYRRQLQRTNLAAVVNFVYCGLMALPILWISYRVLNAVRSALLA